MSDSSSNDPYRESIRRAPWVIVGAGYTGCRLARRLLRAGGDVSLTRRSADGARATAAALGAKGHGLDLEDLDDIRRMAEWLPEGGYVVDCAPPAQRGSEGERELVRSAARAGIGRLVYVSSTGVYPPSDGSWIDEDEPVGPTSRLGRARLASETAILEESEAQQLSSVSLRVVGIYGPGRGVHARLNAGTYRVIGAGDTYVNRVHVDDLVGAIIAAATAPELPRDVYHVADDHPERGRVYADEVSRVMGVPRPPSVPEDEVAPWIVAMLGADRRVSNERLKEELGWRPAYPSWREGLAQVLAEDGIPLHEPIVAE